MLINFYFADNTKQVLKPSKAFENATEFKFVKGKRKYLTIEERVAKIADDLKAQSFTIS